MRSEGEVAGQKLTVIGGAAEQDLGGAGPLEVELDRQGIRLDYAHPLKLDPVAAAHPGLTIVAAHFGWPWHLDLTAIALHKTNVYIDISGWSPRRIPAEVIREMRGRLSGQFLWGSDFPFLTPERCLTELSGLGLPPDTLNTVLRDNAERILGLA